RVPGPAGVEEQGEWSRGFPGNLGDPDSSLEVNRIGSNRYSKLRDDPSALRLKPHGDETQTLQRYRQAKETKCGEKTVRKSQCLIVPLKQGNHPEGPWGGKEASSHARGPDTGKVPRDPTPVHETTTDRAGSGMR